MVECVMVLKDIPNLRLAIGYFNIHWRGGGGGVFSKGKYRRAIWVYLCPLVVFFFLF